LLKSFDWSRPTSNGTQILEKYFQSFHVKKTSVAVLLITFLPISDESRYMAFSKHEGNGQEEPYDHIKDSAFFYDVTEQFKTEMMLDTQACKKCEVSSISKVN
jgi:hypothetical protein